MIIYPHWPPSNLAGVHRPRLIANFLTQLGWHPIIITVHEQYYEETLDSDILKTVNPEIEVIKTQASPILHLFGHRLVGDLGLRGLRPLYREAIKQIRSRKIDFIWIPIPSWYPSLLGRLLNERTGIPYGIDYIDPWVSKLAPYNKVFSKSWWALQLAKILEPVAVHKAHLISGVSAPYYESVIQRNFRNRKITSVAMPYGFDPHDHQIVLDNIEYPWPCDGSVDPYVYAGAFLPQSQLFIITLFQSITDLYQTNQWPSKARVYFLGTGRYSGTSIEEYAAQAGIGHLVFEFKDRFPFLHIQQFLRAAKGILIIGSTEIHYTASKTFQCLLSNRPVFSIFHEESSAVTVLTNCEAAGYLVRYNNDLTMEETRSLIHDVLLQYLFLRKGWEPDLLPLEQYSAQHSAQKLIEAIEVVLDTTISHSISKEQ